MNALTDRVNKAEESQREEIRVTQCEKDFTTKAGFKDGKMGP